MKNRLKLGLFSTLNLGTYFLFQIYIIKSLGSGAHADVFIASTTIPQLVIAVIGGSVGYVLVPVLANESAAKLRNATWTLIYASGALFSLLGVALFLTLQIWLPLTVPGFDLGQQRLCAQLASIQILAMAGHAVVVVQLASQAARGRFIFSESAQFAANCVAILLLAVFLPRYGVFAAAWISCARIVLQSVGLTRGLGGPTWPSGISDVIRTPMARIKPLILGSSYYRTEPAIDRYLLSNAQSGALTQYYLVEQIFAGSSQLLNKVLVGPAVPQLSVYFEEKEFAAFSRLYHKTLMRVFVLAVGALVGLIACTVYLLPAMAPWLNTSFVEWQNLGFVMFVLGGVMVGGACGQIGAGAFYACGDTVTITRMNFLTYSLLIPCKVLAFQAWGLTGLGISASTYSMVNLLLQVLLMRAKLRKAAQSS